MSIPSGMDDLLWRLAESADIKEKAEFVSKHPEYIDELERRSKLLARFRESTPNSGARRRFVPSKEVAPVQVMPNWLIAGVATAVLGSVVFAAASFVRWQTAQTPPTTQLEKPSIDLSTPKVNSPEVQYRADASKQPTAPDGTSNQATIRPPGSEPTAPQDSIQPAPRSRWDSRITLQAENTTLTNAVLAIAAQANVTIEIAPGTPDPDIAVSYSNQSAKAVLDDLGKALGFTVMVQSDHKALLIPARDPQAETPPNVGSESVVPPAGRIELTPRPGKTLPPASPNL